MVAYNPYPGNSGVLPAPRPVPLPKAPAKVAAKKPSLPPALPYPGYLNPGQQQAEATKQLTAAYQPQVDQIKQAIADEQARTAQRAELVRGLYAQLAGIQGQAGQNVSSIYNTAATNQTTFAKGYSDAMQQMVGQNTGQTNATLGLIGAPAGQQISGDKASAAGDVLYGLGGAIPASTLTREGAAFGAAAAMTPGATFGLGMINIQQLENTSARTVDGYVAQLKSLAVEEQGKYPSVLGDIQAQQFKLYTAFTAAKQKAFDAAWAKANTITAQTGYLYIVSNAGALVKARDAQGKPIRTLTGQRLDEQTARDQATAAQKEYDRTHLSAYQAAQLGAGQQSLALRAQIANQSNQTRIGIANANLSAKQQAAQTAQLNKGGYWINPQTNKVELMPGYRYNAATNRVQKISAAATKPKFTPAQLSGFAKTANQFASISKNGYYSTRSDPYKQISQQAAFALMKAAGLTPGPHTNAELEAAGIGFRKNDYQEAMTQLLARGVPLQVAQSSLNRYWTKPGVGGRPTVPFQRRQAAVANAKFEVPPGKESDPRAMAAIDLAKKYLGDPYVWAGSSPKTGFDCSGFVQWLYGQEGIKLGRDTYSQIKDGVGVSKDQLMPGDIIFFGSTADPHHEGMYLGGGLFIHSPHTGDVIKISSLSESYYAQHYVTARRVAGVPGPTGPTP